MDILVMFFLLIIIQINTQGDLDRFSSTNHRHAITGSVEHTETCDICDETTTCVKNQSLLTATRKTERESARVGTCLV